MDRIELLESIEALRTEMYKKAMEKGTFIDPDVIGVSQLLDKVMNEYGKSLQSKDWSRVLVS